MVSIRNQHPIMRIYITLSDIYTEHLLGKGCVAEPKFVELKERVEALRFLKEHCELHPGSFSKTTARVMGNTAQMICEDFGLGLTALGDGTARLLEGTLDLVHLEREQHMLARLTSRQMYQENSNVHYL